PHRAVEYADRGHARAPRQATACRAGQARDRGAYRRARSGISNCERTRRRLSPSPAAADCHRQRASSACQAAAWLQRWCERLVGGGCGSFLAPPGRLGGGAPLLWKRGGAPPIGFAAKPCRASLPPAIPCSKWWFTTNDGECKR